MFKNLFKKKWRITQNPVQTISLDSSKPSREAGEKTTYPSLDTGGAKEFLIASEESIALKLSKLIGEFYFERNIVMDDNSIIKLSLLLEEELTKIKRSRSILKKWVERTFSFTVEFMRQYQNPATKKSSIDAILLENELEMIYDWCEEDIWETLSKNTSNYPVMLLLERMTQGNAIDTSIKFKRFVARFAIEEILNTIIVGIKLEQMNK